MGKVRISRCELTRSDSKKVDGDEEGTLGSTAGKKAGGRSSNQKNVSNTEEKDTPANELEAASLGVGEVTEDQGKSVTQK